MKNDKAKYNRVRKDYRITNYTDHWIKAMKEYYKTSDTAIIEAAVHSFIERYMNGLILETHEKSAAENLRIIEKVKNIEKSC